MLATLLEIRGVDPGTNLAPCTWRRTRRWRSSTSAKTTSSCSGSITSAPATSYFAS